MLLNEWIAENDIDRPGLAAILQVSLSSLYKWMALERVPHLEAAIRIVEITKGEVSFRELLIHPLPPLPALVPSDIAVRKMRQQAKREGNVTLGAGLRHKGLKYPPAIDAEEDDL